MTAESLRLLIFNKEKAARSYIEKNYPLNFEIIESDFEAFKGTFPSIVNPADQVRHLTGRASILSTNNGFAAPKAEEEPEFFYDTNRLVNLAIQIGKDLPENERLSLIDQLTILQAAEVSESSNLLKKSLKTTYPMDLSAFPHEQDVAGAQKHLQRSWEIGYYKVQIISAYKTAQIKYSSLLQTF